MERLFAWIPRTLRRDRAFAAAVVLSLALGIGANTAVFSLVNGVLLRPLPYREPDRLVNIYEQIPKFSHMYPKLPVNFAHYFEWRSRNKSFEQLALLQVEQLSAGRAGQVELVGGIRASANILSTIGIRPALGRDLRWDEEHSGHDVVLISDRLWRNRLSADANIVGSKLNIDGKPFEVIGVLPPDARLPVHDILGGPRQAALPIDYIRPVGYSDDDLQNRLGEHNYAVVGRVRSGIDLPQARAELNVLTAEISKTLEGNLDLRALVEPMQQDLTVSSKGGLLLIQAAVASVLLLLCVNLANLALARGASRNREFAIRGALGASRADLLKQTLVESLGLSVAGGLLGIGLAYASLGVLVRLAPADLPKIQDVTIDLRVLLFGLVLSLISGVLFGFLPALRASSSEAVESLKAGTHTTEGRRGMRVRNTLVAFEAGLSVVLLVTAGLLLSSFIKLMGVDKGFNIERVISARISLPGTKYKENSDRTAYFDRLLEKAGTLPGVTSAGLVSALPLKGETWIDVLGTEKDARPMLERPTVNVRFVSPGYFQTLGISLVDGRMFDGRDRQRKVAILSHNMGEKLWPGEPAVGHKASHNENEALEIVGITPDLRSTSLEADPVRVLYIPYWQRPRTEASLVVRTAMDPAAITSALSQAVHQVDPDVPLPELKTLVEVMNESVAHRRYQLRLIALFALSGLALAAVGLYGVVSYGVTRRRNELGIRMALGARAADLRWMIVAQGVRPVLAGCILGLGGAVAVARLLQSMLFGVSPADPATLVTVIAVLGGVSVVACLLPATRATRINPVESLRYD